MKLSSSDGTNLTIEQLKEIRETLGNVFERIIEINNGTYKRDVEPIQFDYCTCPQLSNEIDSINEIMKRITKFVYQD